MTQVGMANITKYTGTYFSNMNTIQYNKKKKSQADFSQFFWFVHPSFPTFST